VLVAPEAIEGWEDIQEEWKPGTLITRPSGSIQEAP